MLKPVLSVTLLFLITAIFVPAAIGSVSPVVHASQPSANGNPLTVWFNGAFQLTLAYPPAYEFNVAAKTASGLWITSLHWDFGDGATRDVPFSSQSQVSDIEDHQYTSQGNFCVSVTAYDSAGNVATVSQPLLPNSEFSVSATPASQTVAPGASTSYNVAIGQVPLACGGGVSVSLSIPSSPPPGVTWTLNPSSGNTPFTSTLQVQTSSTTPTGTYTITIVGNSANVSHSTTVTLVVSNPYFTLSANPTSLYVPQQTNTQQGQTNTTTVTIQSFNGFNSPVSLSVSGVPSGMNGFFAQSTITPPQNGQVGTLLTFTTPCSVAAGSYVIVIQGTGRGMTKQANVNITVSACTSEEGFSWLWTLILLGVIGLLILIPFLFLLLRPRPVLAPAVIPAAVAVAAPPPPVTPIVPVPQPPAVVPMPCPVCGNPMRPVDLRWYCDICQRFIWVHPKE